MFRRLVTPINVNRYSIRQLSHDPPEYRDYTPSKRRVELVTELTDDILSPPSLYCPNSTLIRSKSDVVIWYKVTYVKITPSLKNANLTENITQLINYSKNTSLDEIEYIINSHKE